MFHEYNYILDQQARVWLVCTMHLTSAAGKPLIYVSHGDQDQVLNVDRCSRRIVPQLQSQGYLVQYHEFKGGHNVPGSIGSEGLRWFLQNKVVVNGGRHWEL